MKKRKLFFQILNLLVVFTMTVGSPTGALAASIGEPVEVQSIASDVTAGIPVAAVSAGPEVPAAQNDQTLEESWSSLASALELAPMMDGSGKADVIYNVGCMEESAGFSLNCTANDVSIAKATNIAILDDGCAYPGDTVTFRADFEVLLTAQARYDVGLWFAQDGDPNGDAAKTGTCTAATPPYAPDPPWLDADQLIDGQENDSCGDITDKAHSNGIIYNPIYPSVTLTVACVDDDGNGMLDLPNCTSWRQPGDNSLCTSPVQAVPGAPSKCKCDDGFNVDIPVPGQIIVDKVTDPSGLATSFDFTLTGAATGKDPITPVTFSLTDASVPFKSSFLYAGTYSVVETANASYATTATCSDGSPANAVVLSPGEIVTCTFTNKLLTGTLIVEKNLVNDNLGPKTCPDFSYTVDGGEAVAFESDCSNSQTVLAGSHTVVEAGVPIEGYTTTYNNCTDVIVPAGGTATCTITNDDIAVPGMTVEKSSTTTSLSAPGTVTYDYVVTNTGNTVLTGISLSDNNDNDDMLCPDTTLAVGASMTCHATHTFTQAELDAGGTLDNTVTADSNETEPVTDDLSIPIVQDPKLSITKVATETSYDAVGDVLNYTITATNIGNTTLAAVTVADALVSGLSCDPANGSALAPGEIMTCTATHTVTQADLDAGHWANQACVDDGADGAPQVCDDEDVPGIIDPMLSISKVATEDTYDSVGDILHYTITATNIGNVTLAAVTVTDPLVSGLTCLPANGSPLAPGDVMTCTATHAVTQTDLDAGHWANQACVDDGSAGATQACDDEDVPGTKNPLLSITKEATETSYDAVGDILHYTIVAKNIGNITLPAVTVTDPLVFSLTCTPDNGSSLAPGAVMTCTATHTVTQADIDAGHWANTSCVDDGELGAPKVCDDEDVPADKKPHLTITKEATETTYDAVGDVLSYTITATNDGNTTLAAVTVTDPLVSGLTCTPANGSTLTPGESMICTATHTVTQADLDAGHWANTACVDDGVLGAPEACDDEDVPGTKNPLLSITKVATETSYDAVGDILHYTIVAKNIGNITLPAVTVTDLLVSDLTCTPANGSSLAPGESMTCTATHTVTQADIEAGNWANTACVDDGETGAPQVCDDEDVPADKKPAIEVTKTADPTAVPETGGDVLFTFTVKNTGNIAVTITSLSDSVYGTLTGDDDCKVGTVLTVDASCTFSITKWVEGDYSGPEHVNVITAKAVDNDNTEATDTDDATVDFTNVLPTIEVTKTANPTAVPETGGDVTFTFIVKNTSTEEPVTITSLEDSLYGALDGEAGVCEVGTVLAAGASCEFTITQWVEGDYSGPNHVNVFTAKAVDNDNTEATDDDDATVDFTNVLPTIEVTKTANPTAVPETGGDVLFTFVVKNTSTEEPVTITSLSDSVYGTLAGDDDCAVDTVLAAGASCEFSITEWVEGDFSGPDHNNVFTAHAKDNDGTDASDDDNATVDFTNVLPTIEVTKTADPTAVPETGGDVTFTFVVKNTSSEEPVTITSLSDSVFGTLTGDDDCKVGTILAADASCTFSFTKWVEGDYSGSDHVNVFTAKAVDNDNTEATDTDDATVDFTNVLPTIEVTKTADPTAVPETGGDVTFTFVVKNTSSEEPVTITSLSDSVFGTLTGDDDCKVGTILAADASCTFSFTKWVEGDYSGSDHVNVFTAKAVDNDNTEATDDDDATVDFTNVLPTIEVTKTANPTAVPETGGDVTFTFIVKNTSTEEPVTITSLSDSVYGTLAGDDDCKVGTILAADASCEFTITQWVEGDYSGSDHNNVFTAHAKDNDGTDASDDDDATVDFTNVLPAIEVTKTANPTAVPETGGDVLFTFVVKNTSTEEPVTITSLEDSLYGTLAGDDDCKVGTVLPAGTSCEFAIAQWVEGDFSGPDHVNAFTGKAVDNDNTEATDMDDATVDFTNVLPTIEVTKTADPIAVPETGGDVTFTFVVKNTSTEEPVTITSLSDSVYGILPGDADCAVGTVLAAGASCEFTITQWVEGDYSGPDHVNVFTAKAVDNDNTEATDMDDATVDFTNVLPTIEVTKTADPTAVPETGGDVTFTFVVKNTSSEEPVTITFLSDSVYGPLTGEAGVCEVGTVLAAGDSCTFSITKWVEGDYSGPDHVNVFTGKAVDNDNTEATDTDDATVDFENVLPTIEVTKTADPIAVPETGGDVTFTFVVTNTSSEEPVTITSLSDSVYGPLTGDDDCKVGTVLAAGASCEFSFTKLVLGDYGSPDHINVFTAKAVDNDKTEATDSDDATVTYTDVLPDIAITKTASPTSVPETGGNVEFTITVTNNSLEDAKITSLSDSVYGTLDGDEDCKVGTVLAADASCEFTITRWVKGDYESGISHENTASVVASDDDGNSDTASDDATVDFTDVAASIDVEKYVSVDGGTTWVDADSPTGPYVMEGDPVQFKFVVTNTGNVALSSISLTDSDFSLADCTIPSSLAVGASFECTISTTAVLEQHTDTATASGGFTDGAGNTETDTDTDDAYYFGMMQGQPSIQIESLSINIDSARTTVTGQFYITDQSTAAKQPDGYLVAMKTYGVRWEQKAKKTVFAPVVPSDGCTYTIVSVDYQQVAGWMPGDPIIFDESITIGYTCTFDSAQLLKGGTLKGTAFATIYARPDMEFTYSSTAAIPSK